MERKHFIALIFLLILGLLMALHYPTYVKVRCEERLGNTPLEYKVEKNQCLVKIGGAWVQVSL